MPHPARAGICQGRPPFSLPDQPELGAAVLAAMLASPALAGGGAHIVGDDATLHAEVCHVETWVSFGGDGGGLAVAAPACTLAALPRLKIAAAVQRGWKEDEGTTIALALFWGAQVKMTVAPDLVLTDEVFESNRRHINADLMAGHRTDRSPGSSLPFGVTIRR